MTVINLPPAQRHDKMNIHCCEKCKSIPEQQKDIVKMLEETGTKVSMSTIKRVLYRHNLKGHSARKKPLLQNRHKLKNVIGVAITKP